SELRRSVPLGIRERMVQEPLGGGFIAKEFTERNRPDPAFGQVEIDRVLPCRLPSLHLERDDFHAFSPSAHRRRAVKCSGRRTRRIPAGGLRPRRGLRPATGLTLNKVDESALMPRREGRKSDFS